jgi:signal transduction histidine kinase
MFVSLGRKVIFAVAVVFLIAGGLFAYFAHQTGYMMLEKGAQTKAHGVAEFGKAILEYIMLSGETEKLQEAMARVVSSNQARDIIILREDGTVTLRARPENLHDTLPLGQFRELSLYPGDKFFLQQEGDSLYEYIITPIVKKQDCYPCHRDAAPTIGYLAVKISMDDVRNVALEHRTMNIFMTVITFLGLAGVVVVTLLFLVIRPVSTLRDQISTIERQTELFEQGEHVRFSELRASTRRDEIGGLINAFNALIRRLNAANDRLRELHHVRLEHADRLATSGEMAASIAHEIKNPTSGVLGALQVLRSELPPDDERGEIFDEMISQLERVTHTVNDLLSYARPTPPSFASVDLVEVFQRTISLLSRQCTKEGVKLSATFSNPSILIYADKKQLQQVLWNVIMNAQHAIAGVGRIDITADESDDSVVIRIDDSGRGIPQHEIEDIFKPFFTTKHKGTGLGMTITKRIVEQHNGTITLKSEVGKGTHVTITLPRKQDNR